MTAKSTAKRYVLTVAGKRYFGYKPFGVGEPILPPPAGAHLYRAYVTGDTEHFVATGRVSPKGYAEVQNSNGGLEWMDPLSWARNFKRTEREALAVYLGVCERHLQDLYAHERRISLEDIPSAERRVAELIARIEALSAEPATAAGGFAG